LYSSGVQVPYIDAGTFAVEGESRPLAFPFTPESRQGVVKRVQQRGAEIMEYLKASSAMSCASAISKHLKDWLGNDVPTEMFSMGVISNGNPYGIPDDLVYSFPCFRRAGDVSGTWRIVPDLPISSEVRQMLDASADELVSEKADAAAILEK
jgi:malate dehydrogenase